jgi:hypothetical protein
VEIGEEMKERVLNEKEGAPKRKALQWQNVAEKEKQATKMKKNVGKYPHNTQSY